MTAMLATSPLDHADLNRVGDPERRQMRRVRKLFSLMIGSDPQPSEGQMRVIREHMLMGDTLADAVVHMYKGLPAGEGRKLVDQALEHGIDSVENPPQALTALFNQIDHEPIWLDREKLRLACDVSHRVGLSGELVLRNLSLMGAIWAPLRPSRWCSPGSWIAWRTGAWWKPENSGWT